MLYAICCMRGDKPITQLSPAETVPKEGFY
jgi:hypothetical protein